MLKARDTYEIMRAEDVGWTANKIVLGKLSGRNAFKQRLQELGIALESESEVNAAFGRFKELADHKAEIFDEDIMAIVSDEAHDVNEHYRFVSLSQRSRPASGRTRAWCSRWMAASRPAKPRAMARWTPPCMPSKARSTAVRNWCCIR